MPANAPRARALFRDVPVRAGTAHMRTTRAQGRPGDEVVCPRMLKSRLQSLPAGLRKKWIKETVKNLCSMLPNEDNDGIKKFLQSSPKKETTPQPAGASSEAGPSGLKPERVRSPRTRSPAGTYQGKKKLGHVDIKKEDKKKSVPVTPPGLSPSKRDGKIAAILVSP